MRLPALARFARPALAEGPDLVPLTVIISFAVTGLCQFLRTTPAQFTAHPVAAAGHWAADSLFTLPLVAAGVWAGDRIAARAGIGLATLSGIGKRALLIVLLVAVALIPLWFERTRTDPLARAQALVTPHSRGSIDVYWVPGGVLVALVCVCLAPAAFWAGRGIAGRLRAARPGGGLLAAVAVPLVLVAAVPAAAWWLQHTAEYAYASQVDNTSALLAVHVHSHAFFGTVHRSRATGPLATAAPLAFVYRFAHALQDGLAGQAAGFPAAVIALLWGTRQTRGHGRYQQAAT